jgi:ribosomal protein S18 acetylase RimI-like enzyme
VERFARRNPYLHLYELGDLDDFFWPRTIWYALQEGDAVQQLVLLYTEFAMPVVQAIAEPPAGLMRDLLHRLLPLLPRRCYAHLSEGVAEVLAADYHIQSHGAFHKMGLTDPARLAACATAEAVALTAADAGDLETFYHASYPGNWFTPRMLETGFYFGIRHGGTLASVAGVHVYSRPYQVAALGNIATRPDVRGLGLGRAVTARVCQELSRAGVAHIGLNVKADNRAAVACYEQVGFTRVGGYSEYTLELK